MNWADYIILAVLVLSVLIGLWRGLISEVLALAVWVAAVWLAWMFGPRVAEYFRHGIDVPSVRIIVAYGLCFVVVLILGALLRFVLHKLVQGTGLSGSDRMLGMVFGLARGAILVTLVVFLLGFTPFPRDPWWQQSRLLPTFTQAADWLGQQLPENVHRYLHPSGEFLPSRLPASMPAQMKIPLPQPVSTPAEEVPAAPASRAGLATEGQFAR